MIRLYLDKEYELDCKEKINYFDILYGDEDTRDTHLRSVLTEDLEDNDVPPTILAYHDNYPYMKKIAENTTTTFYKFINWENPSVSS